MENRENAVIKAIRELSTRLDLVNSKIRGRFISFESLQKMITECFGWARHAHRAEISHRVKKPKIQKMAKAYALRGRQNVNVRIFTTNATDCYSVVYPWKSNEGRSEIISAIWKIADHPSDQPGNIWMSHETALRVVLVCSVFRAELQLRRKNAGVKKV